jgi:anthranilate synthase/aminodeoxychorismate synthase-like glutamine amidotransferase
MILIIDNYDSFVYNLARYVTELGYHTRVVRHDDITIDAIEHLAPQAMIVSPGPCSPDEAGISIAAVTHFVRTLPILGVCLGHQVLAQVFGGYVGRAQYPRHGKTSLVYHDEHRLFAGLTNPIQATRYHSLSVWADQFPHDELYVCAHADDGEIMALRHHHLPLAGVQFHPESVLTQSGKMLLANFLSQEVHACNG